MTTYFTSDSHFGHKNILKFCPERLKHCKDVVDMTEVLIAKWNKEVKPDDVVWHLGDVAMRLKPRDIKPILLRLNGRKRLILGNHDNCATVSKWEDLGFESVLNAAQIKLDGRLVWLNHYPYKEGFWKSLFKRYYYDDRFYSRKLKDENQWLIHGHVHDLWQVKNKMVNVGLDAWNLKPVSEHKIINLMRKADGSNSKSNRKM